VKWIYTLEFNVEWLKIQSCKLWTQFQKRRGLDSNFVLHFLTYLHTVLSSQLIKCLHFLTYTFLHYLIIWGHGLFLSLIMSALRLNQLMLRCSGINSVLLWFIWLCRVLKLIHAMVCTLMIWPSTKTFLLHSRYRQHLNKINARKLYTRTLVTLKVWLLLQ
jgi:hypothetical protein